MASVLVTGREMEQSTVAANNNKLSAEWQRNVMKTLQHGQKIDEKKNQAVDFVGKKMALIDVV